MGKVEVNQEKIDRYVADMRKKLATLQDGEEKDSYQFYCNSECNEWSQDVNYHKAYEIVFGESFKPIKYETEDVPF